MRYKAVLLDMDGTVLDTLEDLASAVNHSLERFGLPQVSVEQVRASLGNGAAWLIGHCVPEGCPKALEERVLAFYKPYYDAHCRERTRPYEGIPALLAALRREGIKLAIISNKPDPAVRELAAAFFPGLLSAAVGESARVRRKPNPDAVLAAAGSLCLPLSACVYVGDSEVDIQTAKNAGMDCISVSWGFRSREQLLEAGAEKIADTAAALERLLREAAPEPEHSCADGGAVV